MNGQPYVPRPRWAVVAFMVSLYTATRNAYGREMWLVDLVSCAQYGRREAHA